MLTPRWPPPSPPLLQPLTINSGWTEGWIKLTVAVERRGRVSGGRAGGCGLARMRIVMVFRRADPQAKRSRRRRSAAVCGACACCAACRLPGDNEPFAHPCPPNLTSLAFCLVQTWSIPHITSHASRNLVGQQCKVLACLSWTMPAHGRCLPSAICPPASCSRRVRVVCAPLPHAA